MSFLGYTTSVISGAGETDPFVVAGVLPVSMVARDFCFHCTLVFVLLLVVFFVYSNCSFIRKSLGV